MSISQRIRKQLEQTNGLTKEKLEPLAAEYADDLSSGARDRMPNARNRPRGRAPPRIGNSRGMSLCAANGRLLSCSLSAAALGATSSSSSASND